MEYTTMLTLRIWSLKWFFIIAIYVWIIVFIIAFAHSIGSAPPVPPPFPPKCLCNEYQPYPGYNGSPSYIPPLDAEPLSIFLDGILVQDTLVTVGEATGFISPVNFVFLTGFTLEGNTDTNFATSGFNSNVGLSCAISCYTLAGVKIREHKGKYYVFGANFGLAEINVYVYDTPSSVPTIHNIVIDGTQPPGNDAFVKEVRLIGDVFYVTGYYEFTLPPIGSRGYIFSFDTTTENSVVVNEILFDPTENLSSGMNVFEIKDNVALIGCIDFASPALNPITRFFVYTYNRSLSNLLTIKTITLPLGNDIIVSSFIPGTKVGDSVYLGFQQNYDQPTENNCAVLKYTTDFVLDTTFFNEGVYSFLPREMSPEIGITDIQYLDGNIFILTSLFDDNAFKFIANSYNVTIVLENGKVVCYSQTTIGTKWYGKIIPTKQGYYLVGGNVSNPPFVSEAETARYVCFKNDK